MWTTIFSRKPLFKASSLMLVLLFSASPWRNAQALTVMLNFVTASTTDEFGVSTTSANYAPYGFTGMNTSQIQQAALAAVTADFLDYPTVAENALSPLPANKELNINFELSFGLTSPANMDSEYFYVNIGDDLGSNSFLGQACYTCVRDASGAGPTGVSSGDIVGSILVDNIASLAVLASNDSQRINLLAGTIAHEIGHTLALDHPGSALANPGASTFDIMATGASPTSMPNGERIKDRAFAYSNFDILIDAVGLRDASLPEPEAILLLVLGFAILAYQQNRVSRRYV